ncbi:hypothetical protein ACN38_g9862 [Penicillium nordicum]|uniref:Uncharacterized protein n=1 Tax=Penicillium nordicum TaxID=229535 RepID=A0A0M9WC72_9EURO|nr:hypothetical protein ACN38_g9862 [Penicillium nordicum]
MLTICEVGIASILRNLLWHFNYARSQPWSPSAHGSGVGGSPLYSGHSGQKFTHLNIPHPNIQPVQQKVSRATLWDVFQRLTRCARSKRPEFQDTSWNRTLIYIG